MILLSDNTINGFNKSIGMKKKVLVGLSWWVDSAVAAYLLLQQGHEVIAGFMKNYADESNPDCHTREDRNMAIKVAQHLGITTFVIFDFRTQYHETIIKYIYETYHQWLTPNPDVLCNTEIKFKLFLEEGKKLGCDYVATWHYARIDHIKNKFRLLKWVDENKDQSYFLSWLNQEQLSRSLFPLGEMKKPEVRKLAEKIWLPNADRKDSQWLCFIGKVDMKTFLQEALPTETGPIKDTTGKVLWEHEWVWFYTIWQRQWLGLAGGPRYVIKRDIENNELIVGHEDISDLMSTELTAKQWHRVGDEPTLPYQAHAKIRYRQPDQACTVAKSDENGIYHIRFQQEQRAISPWQTVVIYDGDELVASGIIC